MNMLIDLEDKSEAADDECVRVELVDEVCFYTIEDLMPLLGWSRVVVQKLFNDPKFPSTDYGKQKVVEKHALIKYFSVRHAQQLDDNVRRLYERDHISTETVCLMVNLPHYTH